MICIVALFALAAMSIFSARYRPWAKEAFDCVFRRITLRPCNTNFDQKVKSRIVGKMMKRHPKCAKLIFRHFEAISWALTILLVVSLIFAGIGIYNYAKYGNCNGLGSDEFCVFELVEGEEQVVCSASPSCVSDACGCEVGQLPTCKYEEKRAVCSC